MPKITGEHILAVKMRIRKNRKDMLICLEDLKQTEDDLDTFIIEDNIEKDN